MLDIWKDAKKNKKILHFKNFQKPEVTWEDTLNFTYNLSSIYNEEFNKRSSSSGAKAVGSVLVNGGYFIFDESNLFPIFNGVSELMIKVNGGINTEKCNYYKQKNIGCSFDCYWHIQTLRFSITNHKVLNHNDPNDVLYWQLLGNSKWIMNQNTEYILNPGDLLYFNQEDSHEVLQDGPRAGIIIDSRKKEAQ